MTAKRPFARAGQYLARHRALLLTLFLGILVPLRVVWELGEGVWERGGFALDRVVLQWLHGQASPGLDSAALLASRLGGPLVMTVFGVLVALVLLVRRRRGEALFFVLGAGGAVALNLLIKLLIGRARPDLWVSLAPEPGFSFPSGHAMGTAAVAASLAFLAWPTRWRWPALALGALFAFSVGISRMYLGVHFPSDVLAGWSAAVGWVVGVHQLLAVRLGRWGGRSNL